MPRSWRSGERSPSRAGSCGRRLRGHWAGRLVLDGIGLERLPRHAGLAAFGSSTKTVVSEDTRLVTRHAGPAALDNPMLDALTAAQSANEGDVAEARADALRRFGFAVPTAAAVWSVRRHAPHGVIEIGAGTGYWAYLARQVGVDVVAVDIEPAPSAKNKWFAATPLWYPVQASDHTCVERFTDRTLLLVWPTRDEVWPADTLVRYRRGGGRCVVYVGEGPGGHCGDDVFHARLGRLRTCTQCVYGVMEAPCICGVEADWRCVETVELPHWPGFADDLHVFVRAPSDGPHAGGEERRRDSWRRRRPEGGR